LACLCFARKALLRATKESLLHRKQLEKTNFYIKIIDNTNINISEELMNVDDIKKQIKKYGRTAYIAEKGAVIQKKFDPIKKELNLLLPGLTPISIFEKPLSLIGTVSHQQASEEWPSIEENLACLFCKLQLTCQFSKSYLALKTSL
jgi:GTPase involved in cell partitioning and DNA repair